MNLSVKTKQYLCIALLVAGLLLSAVSMTACSSENVQDGTAETENAQTNNETQTPVTPSTDRTDETDGGDDEDDTKNDSTDAEDDKTDDADKEDDKNEDEDTVKPMTYKAYTELSSEDQQAYFNSFASIEDFFLWYNEAKRIYDEEQDRVVIDGNNGNLGDIINGKK